MLIPRLGSLSSLAARGAERAAADFNLRLIVYETPEEGIDEGPEESNHLTDYFAYNPNQLCGTVLFFGAFGQGLQALKEAMHPTVLVMRSDAGLPSVVTAAEDCIAALVRRLHRCGHRRIAFLKGPARNPAAEERLRGYRRGLSSCGIILEDRLVLLGEFNEHSSFCAVMDSLDQGIAFTAIIAGNDQSAIGALRALKSRNVSVPDRVEVVGFDNLHSAAMADPSLTTFELPMEAMSYAAIENIVKILRDEPVPMKTCVPPRFIQRNSTRFVDFDPALDRRSWLSAPEAVPQSKLTEILETIPKSGSPAEFLAGSESAVAEAIRLGVDLHTVASELLSRADAKLAHRCLSSDQRTMYSAALSLMLITANVSRSKAVEHAETFNRITRRVRHLRVEKVNEETVISQFCTTLSDLGVKEAWLFLECSAAVDAASEQQHFVAWDFQSGSVTGTPSTADAFHSKAMDLSERNPTTRVIPLVVNSRIIGHLVADGGSRFSDNLAELIEHITGAIRNVRLYGHLASINKQLRETQRELIEVSRCAGVAEMAAGILHNIGNALNSVNTSTGVVCDRLNSLKLESVSRIEQLLLDESEPWGGAFRRNERGVKIVNYIRSLHDHLQESRVALKREAQLLRESVDHVNQTVAAQQSFAQIAGAPEDLDPSEPMRYALRLCEAELLRDKIDVVREFGNVPAVRIERHKVVQIMVNLIRNAKDALAGSPRQNRRLRLGVRLGQPSCIECYVSDNGMGITAENLNKVFSMGFTTKEGRHGFGLHNSAIAADSMGGVLSVHSEGTGCGATFALTLPCRASAGVVRL